MALVLFFSKTEIAVELSRYLELPELPEGGASRCVLVFGGIGLSYAGLIRDEKDLGTSELPYVELIWVELDLSLKDTRK